MSTSSLAASKRLRKELQVLKQQARQQAQKQKQQHEQQSQNQSSSQSDNNDNDHNNANAASVEDGDDILLQVNPDNLLLWKGWIRGPMDTPYEGGVFQLDIRCGMDYPLAPPTIRFVTKVRAIADASADWKLSSFVTPPPRWGYAPPLFSRIAGMPIPLCGSPGRHNCLCSSTLDQSYLQCVFVMMVLPLLK